MKINRCKRKLPCDIISLWTAHEKLFSSYQLCLIYSTFLSSLLSWVQRIPSSSTELNTSNHYLIYKKWMRTPQMDVPSLPSIFLQWTNKLLKGGRRGPSNPLGSSHCDYYFCVCDLMQVSLNLLKSLKHTNLIFGNILWCWWRKFWSKSRVGVGNPIILSCPKLLNLIFQKAFLLKRDGEFV